MDWDYPQPTPLEARPHALFAIYCALHYYEGKRWREIEQIDRCHYVARDGISHESRERLERLGRGHEEEKLFQLNLYYKHSTCPSARHARLFGIRYATALILLWYDPNHLVFERAAAPPRD